MDEKKWQGMVAKQRESEETIAASPSLAKAPTAAPGAKEGVLSGWCPGCMRYVKNITDGKCAVCRTPLQKIAAPEECPGCRNTQLEGHAIDCPFVEREAAAPDAGKVAQGNTGDQLRELGQEINRPKVAEREATLFANEGPPRAFVDVLRLEMMSRFSDRLSMEEISSFAPFLSAAAEVLFHAGNEDYLATRAEAARLTALINTPELIDFEKAVQIEAVHQRERWGTEHDEGKTAPDWFWLLGYLAGKALHSDKVGDRDKLLHHIITTAAACANWHAQVLGKCDMRPGIAAPAGEKS